MLTWSSHTFHLFFDLLLDLRRRWLDFSWETCLCAHVFLHDFDWGLRLLKDWHVVRVSVLALQSLLYVRFWHFHWEGHCCALVVTGTCSWYLASLATHQWLGYSQPPIVRVFDKFIRWRYPVELLLRYESLYHVLTESGASVSHTNHDRFFMACVYCFYVDNAAAGWTVCTRKDVIKDLLKESDVAIQVRQLVVMTLFLADLIDPACVNHAQLHLVPLWLGCSLQRFNNWFDGFNRVEDTVKRALSDQLRAKIFVETRMVGHLVLPLIERDSLFPRLLFLRASWSAQSWSRRASWEWLWRSLTFEEALKEVCPAIRIPICISILGLTTGDFLGLIAHFMHWDAVLNYFLRFFCEMNKLLDFSLCAWVHSHAQFAKRLAWVPHIFQVLKQLLNEELAFHRLCLEQESVFSFKRQLLCTDPHQWN